MGALSSLHAATAKQPATRPPTKASTANEVFDFVIASVSSDRIAGTSLNFVYRAAAQNFSGVAHLPRSFHPKRFDDDAPRMEDRRAFVQRLAPGSAQHADHRHYQEHPGLLRCA